MALARTCLDAGATVVITDVLTRPEPEIRKWQNIAPEKLLYFRYITLCNRREQKINQIADLQSCDLTKKEEIENTFARILEKVHYINGV